MLRQYQFENCFKSICFICFFYVNLTAMSFNSNEDKALLDKFASLQSMINNDSYACLSSIPVEKAHCADCMRGSKEKEWTILIYMAADNDLQRYAIRNIKQMATIGSTEYVNIVVHLDIREKNKKVCSRFYVEKEKILQFDTGITKMDSGDPQSVISFVKWATTQFPSNHVAIIFWDHATGIVDPSSNRLLRATDLFSFNPATHKLELDRSIDFLELMNESQSAIAMRGVCWDDSTGHYLTNQKLAYALQTLNITFDVLGFDACLMSMLEIASILKHHAKYLVASQEVELGTGWNYHSVFAPFTRNNLTPLELARHIVNVYEKTYSPYTNDYTLSVLNLSEIINLENNINVVAELLLACLRMQVNGSVKKAVQMSRHRRLCTHFDTPQYIDLHHFYRNLQVNLKSVVLSPEHEGTRLKLALFNKLEEGKNIIDHIVMANVTGKNLAQAKGISVYFPEQRIHPSYLNTVFATQNSWPSLLSQTIPVTY